MLVIEETILRATMQFGGIIAKYRMRLRSIKKIYRRQENGAIGMRNSLSTCLKGFGTLV
jgi:hypothetical protein